MLQKKLLITLTTSRGSRQYTLGQLARYLLALFLVMAVCSFFVSNLLLVQTSGALDNLEEGIDSLSSQYEVTLGTQELQKGQLDQLSHTLQELKVERGSVTGRKPSHRRAE